MGAGAGLGFAHALHGRLTRRPLHVSRAAGLCPPRRPRRAGRTPGPGRGRAAAAGATGQHPGSPPAERALGAGPRRGQRDRLVSQPGRGGTVPFDPFTQRPGNLTVVGAFVHNGATYSAPGFITCLTLWNEEHTYAEPGPRLASIAYGNTAIAPGISNRRTWDRDAFAYDPEGRLTGWTRVEGERETVYSPDGLLVRAVDEEGRPAEASEVTYAPARARDTTLVRPRYPAEDWRHRLAYVYHEAATAPATRIEVELDDDPATHLGVMTPPEHGTLATWVSGNRRGYRYQPRDGFSGEDAFTLMARNETREQTRAHRVRMTVACPASGLGPHPRDPAVVLEAGQP